MKIAKALIILSILSSCTSFSTGLSTALKFEHEVVEAIEAVEDVESLKK